MFFNMNQQLILVYALLSAAVIKLHGYQLNQLHLEDRDGQQLTLYTDPQSRYEIIRASDAGVMLVKDFETKFKTYVVDAVQRCYIVPLNHDAQKLSDQVDVLMNTSIYSKIASNYSFTIPKFTVNQDMLNLSKSAEKVARKFCGGFQIIHASYDETQNENLGVAGDHPRKKDDRSAAKREVIRDFDKSCDRNQLLAEFNKCPTDHDRLTVKCKYSVSCQYGNVNHGIQVTCRPDLHASALICCDYHCPTYPHWPSQFAWSSAGPIAGKKCTQIVEMADPHTWSDNYFCWTQDHGKKNPNIQWRSWGKIPGMRCTQILEAADPHTWSDNYLCVPHDSPYNFRWSSAGPIAGLQCIQWLEASDPHTWSDNYLCA